jgi:prepilin-type processing-associated H-X9-DG protein
VKRGKLVWAQIDFQGGKFVVVSNSFSNPPDTSQLKNVSGLSWAALLLPRLERQDIWEQIVEPILDQNDQPIPVQIPPMEVYVCPSDTDAVSQASLPGLSYNANSGAWDFDGSGDFLVGSNVGDTTDNGVFVNLLDYARQIPLPPGVKVPKVRLGTMKDGAGTTLMYSENIHKSYGTQPMFGWVGNRIANEIMEQRFGMVWVVDTAPAAAVQERINGNTADLIDFPFATPQYARPASSHSGGVNAAFCDGNVRFVRDDVDYIVYQALLTPNGRKCVDPTIWNPPPVPIVTFRSAPPLSEEAYQ